MCGCARYIGPMTVFLLDQLTWNDVSVLAKENLVTILPIGATEAHGLHLPVCTDTIISKEWSYMVATEISEKGFNVVILPPLPYTVAQFAENFSGTISVEPQAMESILNSICRRVREWGVKYLIVINSHFDPAHMAILRRVFGSCKEPQVIFPDVTRRKLAELLTEEFKSGSCHAGCFETSLIMRVAPGFVRNEFREFSAYWVNLPEKTKAGAKHFEEIGMDKAYCGDPAKATAEEGKATFQKLTEIVVEAFLECVKK